MGAHTLEIEGTTVWVEDRGTGPALLLLHGFTGSGADWEQVLDLDALAERYRVIVPDARGHGRSAIADASFSHRQCARDVAAILDALDVQRTSAIGMSLGGNTLLHLATMDPDRVEAMITISAPSYFAESGRAIMRTFSADDRSEGEWALMRQRHHHGDEQIRALYEIGRGFADQHDDMAFTPPKLATIRARTLIVAGDRDPFAPVEIAVEQYRAIPRCSLWVVPDAGHDAVFGPAKDTFVRTALDFLAVG
ncbi:MAG: alpha/beta hydrolase [Myxococcota bacterium]